MTLKSNELLMLFYLLKKADLEELKQISHCCEDEFVLKHGKIYNCGGN
jgi:hypothetical protein